MLNYYYFLNKLIFLFDLLDDLPFKFTEFKLFLEFFDTIPILLVTSRDVFNILLFNLLLISSLLAMLLGSPIIGHIIESKLT